MHKNAFHTVKLAKGEMNVYDFGGIRLHAYKTNDCIDDEVFIIEKNDEAVLIESPCFFDNNEELTEYLKDMPVAGMLIAYHGAGGTFLPGVAKYATQNAIAYSQSGGGKALIDNFASAFGNAFDSSIHKITNVVESGKVTIGGMEFLIKQTADAFDVEIPEINAVYTHMLGHDCHSIVAGAGHADAIIAQLRGYQEAGIDLAQVQPEALDMPFGLASGAGAIFGVTGGVTEAVLRRLVNSSRTEDLEEISFSGIRGVDGIKEAKVNLNGREVKIAVVNGLHCAEDLLEKMKAGEAHYDFVEVMACKRGCIAGGGQPVPIGPRTKKARLEGIYKIDNMAQIKLSNENPIITEVYAGILKGKEHKLLHNEMNV